MSILDKIDPPLIKKEYGALHPINQTKDYLLNLLAKIGFEEVHGPEIETEEYNFYLLFFFFIFFKFFFFFFFFFFCIFFYFF
jgi:hypothetical protein